MVSLMSVGAGTVFITMQRSKLVAFFFFFCKSIPLGEQEHVSLCKTQAVEDKHPPHPGPEQT